VGRGGLIISPFIVLALFDSSGIGGAIGTISGIYLALLMAAFGVETNRQSLEALEPDAPDAMRSSVKQA
jgi:putative MFS transporter